ncbi:hypothetical protein Ciccas_004163 [Cichlidogyrus casuarinus]|uniref:Uncharacterized protein n=1 Tax=Cichlidogyrus casuarinus TaxID=1844966 RepID=A0ABD2QD41_9PLAT
MNFPEAESIYKELKDDFLKKNNATYLDSRTVFFTAFPDWVRGHQKELFLAAGGDEKLWLT